MIRKLTPAEYWNYPTDAAGKCENQDKSPLENFQTVKRSSIVLGQSVKGKMRDPSVYPRAGEPRLLKIG